MKTREGFVSNSSSSSFVVAFSVQTPDLHDIVALFGSTRIQAYDEVGDFGVLVQDTQSQAGVFISHENRNELWARFFAEESFYYDTIFSHPEGKVLYEKQNNIHPWADTTPDEKERRMAEYYALGREIDGISLSLKDEMVDEWITENQGRWAFGYDYSDNDCQGALEHGDHWEHAGALRFSHH